MARHILLLRGINIGSRNRIAMGELRDALAATKFDDVQTYLQSGNVIVSRSGPTAAVVRDVERLIAKRFGLEVAVVGRTPSQLRKVVERNPFVRIAKDPKRYQVSFLAAKPTRDLIRRVEAAADAKERVVVEGREIYAWHPDTIARSKLWALLAGQNLGVTATARNWTTVQKLLELADARAPS